MDQFSYSIQFCLLSVCVSRSGWKWVKSFPNHLQLKSFQKPMRQKISNHVCGNNFVSWSRREKWCWSCFPLHQFSLRMSQELAQCSVLWLVFQWRLLEDKSPTNLLHSIVIQVKKSLKFCQDQKSLFQLQKSNYSKYCSENEQTVPFLSNGLAASASHDGSCCHCCWENNTRRANMWVL